MFFFFFSSRRRHTRYWRDWSSDVCSSDLMLAASPELSFTELRDALAMTDGNLTTHIKALQQEGYVSVAKSYQNNRPLTTCSLTAAGRKAFAEYINLLEQIVRQNKPK